MLGVALAAVLMLLGLAGSWVTAVFSHHRAAQAAADLAALAGAAAAQRGEEPCAAAARIASANDSAVTGCSVVGDDVWVTVDRPAPALFGRSATVRGRARAGPAP